MPKLISSRKNYTSKEVSWLFFNDRVLQEANNPNVPLIERLKFLGIYSNNLDEYFRVRVAIVKRLAPYSKKMFSAINAFPDEVLKDINTIVSDKQVSFDKTYQSILKELKKNNIYIINEKNIPVKHVNFIENYFSEKVRPNLVPIMLDNISVFPELKDDKIYMAICLSYIQEKAKTKYALIEVPTGILPRFLLLPTIENEPHCIILLEDIIRFGLKDIFYSLSPDVIDSYSIKLTRDAEMDLMDNLFENYVQNIKSGVKKRKEGYPVRFVCDPLLPETYLVYLMKKLKFKNRDSVVLGGRYHNFKDFMSFPAIGGECLRYEEFHPLPHRDLKPHVSIIKTMKEKDVMLTMPYHSFSHFIDLLREAAIDPKVTEINITLYRVAKNSAVVNALINAIKNGKTVVAVVEIQARFDEEANIYWSNRLREEGARVIYGVQGLKCHSKLCLIKRLEKKREVAYTCVGTGNFNEDTARLYTDNLLFTTDVRITNDVVKVFDFLKRNYKHSVFRNLIVSPFYARKNLIKQINNEIKNAKKGYPAFIKLKLNNLTDPQLIDLLYLASNAGVKISLIIRGMFSLVTGVPNQSENIKAIGIVDRFLEHSRVFIFCNNGNENYYISSSDIMMRNLDHRVEVTCPIFDKSIQKELADIFSIQENDNVKARILNGTLTNEMKQRGDDLPIRSQFAVYEYLKKIN